MVCDGHACVGVSWSVDETASAEKEPDAQGVHVRSVVDVAWAEKNEPGAHVAVCARHAVRTVVVFVEALAVALKLPAAHGVHVLSAVAVAGAA